MAGLIAWLACAPAGPGLPDPWPDLPPPCAVEPLEDVGSSWSAATWTPAGWAVGEDGRVTLRDGLDVVEVFDVPGRVHDVVWAEGALWLALGRAGLWRWDGELTQVHAGHIRAVDVGAQVWAADEDGALWTDGVPVAVPGRPLDVSQGLVAAASAGVWTTAGEAPVWPRWLAARDARSRPRVARLVVADLTWLAVDTRLVRCGARCTSVDLLARVADLVVVGDTAFAVGGFGLVAYDGGSPANLLRGAFDGLAARGDTLLLVAPDRLVLWKGGVVDQRTGSPGPADRSPPLTCSAAGAQWALEPHTGRLTRDGAIAGQLSSPAPGLVAVGERCAAPLPRRGLAWLGADERLFEPGAHDVAGHEDGWVAARGTHGLVDQAGRACRIPGRALWVDAGPEGLAAGGEGRAFRVRWPP